MKLGQSFTEAVPKDSLPRERLELVGEKALSNQELLAILLRTGDRQKNVLELSAAILKKFQHLYELKNATLYELMQIRGIGKIKAIELRAAIEFGYRLQQSTQFRSGKISSSYQIAQQLLYELRDFQQEHLICVYLNTKNEIIRQETVFKGSLNQSINNSMYLKIIFNYNLTIKDFYTLHKFFDREDFIF